MSVERGREDRFWDYCAVEHQTFEGSMSVLCILGLRKTKPRNIERLQEEKWGLRLKVVSNAAVR
jgi:hypothetical protein